MAPGMFWRLRTISCYCSSQMCLLLFRLPTTNSSCDRPLCADTPFNNKLRKVVFNCVPYNTNVVTMVPQIKAGLVRINELYSIGIIVSIFISTLQHHESVLLWRKIFYKRVILRNPLCRRRPLMSSMGARAKL